MKTFTAAVVQTASVAFDPKRTIEKLGDFTGNAASKGAELVVFPEAFVGGYPKGLDFGARVGSRTATGRDSFKTYYEGAIDVPGEHTLRLGEIAGGHALHLVTGVIERDHGTLYCTVLFFGPDGNLLGKHRKLMPTAAERLVWGFGDGSTRPAYDTPLGTLGAVICWENYMPMNAQALVVNIPEIVLGFCIALIGQRKKIQHGSPVVTSDKRSNGGADRHCDSVSRFARILSPSIGDEQQEFLF
jgi:nitrilase